MIGLIPSPQCPLSACSVGHRSCRISVIRPLVRSLTGAHDPCVLGKPVAMLPTPVVPLMALHLAVSAVPWLADSRPGLPAPAAVGVNRPPGGLALARGSQPKWGPPHPRRTRRGKRGTRLPAVVGAASRRSPPRWATVGLWPDERQNGWRFSAVGLLA